MICILGRHRRRMSAVHPEPGVGAGPPPVGPAVLDAQAIARLRELDPHGTQGIVPRVLRAYENALLRQLEEFDAARAADDAERVSRLAHTLKSSSASVGAHRLSRLCAEAERALRTQQPNGLGPQLEELIHEARQVLAAVRAMLQT